MDKTPTLKTTASPPPPSQKEILDEAEKRAEENREYIGATVSKSLTSPMLMRSPSLQARMIEYAEQVIDPVSAETPAEVILSGEPVL